MHTQSLIEAAKDAARVAVVAACAALADMLVTGQLNWQTLVVLTLAAVLKGADKYVHENPNINANGILPF